MKTNRPNGSARGVLLIGAALMAGALSGCLWEAAPENATSEKVIYSADAGREAAIRSAEQHCNRFARESVLIEEPPQSASYVFYCY